MCDAPRPHCRHVQKLSSVRRVRVQRKPYFWTAKEDAILLAGLTVPSRTQRAHERRAALLREHGENAPSHRSKKTACLKCGSPELYSATLCREHHVEYMRGWRKNRTAKFHQMK